MTYNGNHLEAIKGGIAVLLATPESNWVIYGGMSSGVSISDDLAQAIIADPEVEQIVSLEETSSFKSSLCCQIYGTARVQLRRV